MGRGVRSGWFRGQTPGDIGVSRAGTSWGSKKINGLDFGFNWFLGMSRGWAARDVADPVPGPPPDRGRGGVALGGGRGALSVRYRGQDVGSFAERLGGSARSSLKTCSRSDFRALRAPHPNPLPRGERRPVVLWGWWGACVGGGLLRRASEGRQAISTCRISCAAGCAPSRRAFPRLRDALRAGRPWPRRVRPRSGRAGWSAPPRAAEGR